MSSKILAALALAGACGAASAGGGHVNWSVSIGGPVLPGVAVGTVVGNAPVYHPYRAYRPAPVYYPAPVVAVPVYGPPPVIYRPAPVYVPAPVYAPVYGYGGHKHRHHHRHHHRHGRDDD